MDKRFLAILGIIVVLFVGVIWYKGQHKTSNSGNGNNTTASATNHVQGQGKKNVTLVEYGDFECSACETYYPAVEQVVEKYKNDITFQFRNLPLTQIHQNAFAAARAAEAASLQGKFWEMYNQLYGNQQQWISSKDPLTIFKAYASQLGLNADQFATDYASGKVNDTINADVAAFNKLGYPLSTPTFILDGKKVTPAATVEDFSKVIDAEIATKNP